MSVKIRPYQGGDSWEVDVRIDYPDGTEHRERRKAPVSSKSAAKRWGKDRERFLLQQGKPPARDVPPKKEVPTLTEFGPRFVEGYARANRQKPSGIAAKETILKVHLVPALGGEPLDAITNEHVQRLKLQLSHRAPKTVNNVLTVLNTLLKVAVEWRVIERLPCTVRLVKTSKPSHKFHDFEEFDRLVQAATELGGVHPVIVLLGGAAGLRLGEILALEWRDVDLAKRQICIERSEWKGHVTAPKGGRLRYVPMTKSLLSVLQQHRHLRGRRVVCQSSGDSFTMKMVQDAVRRAAQRAKVKHEGVHVLRHTFCSHLAMRGAPARSIQELAGHQDLATTQRYMHLSPLAIRDAIQLLDRGGIPESFGDMLETGSIQNTKSIG